MHLRNQKPSAVNDKPVNSPKEATELLEARRGRIKLEGIDVDGSRFIYVL